MAKIRLPSAPVMVKGVIDCRLNPVAFVRFTTREENVWDCRLDESMRKAALNTTAELVIFAERRRRRTIRVGKSGPMATVFFRVFM